MLRSIAFFGEEQKEIEVGGSVALRRIGNVKHDTTKGPRKTWAPQISLGHIFRLPRRGAQHITKLITYEHGFIDVFQMMVLN